MAQAMNAIGYDAAALGNHEFNYGIPVLRKFEEQCDFPLLGANALDAKTLRPAFPPYVIKGLRTPHGRDVRVAVLGLTNPGIAIWDKANVQGKMTFPGLEEQAAKCVPKLRSMGADVVIVSAHSGRRVRRRTGTSCRTWRTRPLWWRSRCRGSTRSWWVTRMEIPEYRGDEQGDGQGGGVSRSR